jgi:serine/threonine protein kinase
VDLLGSGKKNTKIYKAEHLPTGKIYAIKEVEAKTLEKLNEYKVSGRNLIAGRSRAAVEGARACQRALILRLLLLRDYVQYFPHRNGL